MKQLIERANHTQRSLSDATGLTEKTINDLVRGVSIPRLDRALLIARELGCTLEELCIALGLEVKSLETKSSPKAEEGHYN